MTETNKKKQDYLWRYAAACEEMDQLEEEMLKWLGKANKLTATLSDMPAGGDRLQMDDAICKYMEIMEMLNKKIAEAMAIKIEIDKYIDTIPNSRLKNVLRLRYTNGMKWEEICVKLDCSWQHVHRMHIYALEALEEIKKIDLGDCM